MQDTLVQIIQLEKAKLKVAEIVEEEKQNLRDITERVSKKYEREYNIEKERTLKELEEAGQRVFAFSIDFSSSQTNCYSYLQVMEKVDLDCSEIEEVLAKTQRDIEAREKEFQEVEDRILASKSFYQKPLSVDALRSIKLEQRKLQDVTEEAAQNPFRFAMFLVLAVLVGLSLMESLGAEDVNWLSVTAFSLILFAIFARLYKETS